MRPDGRSRPAGSGAAPSDQLDGGSPHSVGDRTDRDAVNAATEAAYVGVLLVSGQRAAELLDRLPHNAIGGAVHRWALATVRAALDSGATPDPITAADAALRAGIEPPPGLSGQQLAALHRLASAAPAPAMADYYRGLVIGNAARRTVATAGAALTAGAWLGSLADLAELVTTETSSADAAVAEARRVVIGNE